MSWNFNSEIASINLIWWLKGMEAAELLSHDWTSWANSCFEL